jgi:hypothetical protein
MERIRGLLEQMRDQLSDGGEHRFAGDVDAALASCDDAVAAYVMSNELWGGAGSIAEEALNGRSPARRQLEELLIRLGGEQVARGCANPRTAMWASVFQERHSQNI